MERVVMNEHFSIRIQFSLKLLSGQFCNRSAILHTLTWWRGGSEKKALAPIIGQKYATNVAFKIVVNGRRFSDMASDWAIVICQPIKIYVRKWPFSSNVFFLWYFSVTPTPCQLLHNYILVIPHMYFRCNYNYIFLYPVSNQWNMRAAPNALSENSSF